MSDQTLDDLIRDMHAILDGFVAAGWATGWKPGKDRPLVDWTPKGIERRAALRAIDAELGPNLRGLQIIHAICCVPTGEDLADKSVN